MGENILQLTDQAKRFQILMLSHFPGVTIYQIETLTCGMCQDFKKNYCLGKNLKGKDVARCMWDRAGEVEIEIIEQLFDKSFMQ